MSAARGAASAGNGSAAVSQNQEVTPALMNLVQTPMMFLGGIFLLPLTSLAIACARSSSMTRT